jgi:hypothetical protein
MTPEFKSVMQQAAAAQSLSFKDVSRFTPTDIRLGIQWLMAEEQNDLAQALADARTVKTFWPWPVCWP